ncbi:nucleolar MIF4G domain-containing protein 1 homolog [Ctenocephalides felis]|uniref:nucleolar MIF4G domain-containing protein 1 homolog n=1 Tax=Ctenocephalides felis TaxID=7515 RepID=UPI000E6E2389|nr:nucleolar MIF4G domain-containing protein 1 homolog [Ctenocephalides felis]
MGSIRNKKDKTKNKLRKTRKETRKEKRQQKKVNRNVYYSNKNKKNQDPTTIKNNVPKNPTRENDDKKQKKGNSDIKKSTKSTKKQSLFVNDVIRDINKEKSYHKSLENEMMKNRKKQLQEANELEDQSIKKLEKQLNLKHKQKIPKSFAEDGLDYVLELCDSNVLAQKAKTEKQLVNLQNFDELDDDNFLQSDEESSISNNSSTGFNSENDKDSEFENQDENSGLDDSENQSDVYSMDSEDDCEESKNESTLEYNLSALESNDSENSFSDDEMAVSGKCIQKKSKRSQKLLREAHVSENSGDSDSNSSMNEQNDFKEDIYGRKRDKQGNIVQENTKYIPPQVRARMLSGEQSEKLQRLKRQIKGLLNKLTEQNIHSISSEIENVYRSNSHHDTNDTLANLSLEFLVNVNSVPDIMIAHHAMLISVLHANVGSDIGAYYLQNAVKQFNTLLSEELPIENKKTENITAVLSHLYNFKIFSSLLLLDILKLLSEDLNEKRLDCILIILRVCGFLLRKENPGDLKELILKLQAAANKAISNSGNNSRVKFLVDVLLAIKNNNVSKIPSYDPTLFSNLIKVVRNYYRKGNYVTTLNVSLQDMINADVHGRWWSVGSAWSGSGKNNTQNSDNTSSSNNAYSEKLLELARKQGMNTEIRKNIFCAIMSGEDYLNAFEKVLHLGLKGSQEQELVHVLLSCCLQEKKYNPYYSLLAQKFCDLDRKYRISFQYSLWDKIRDLSTLTNDQISHLGKFMIHLLIENGLSLCVLKIIDFSELQARELRLIRQILFGILLNPSEAIIKHIFERILKSPKLKMFRESLRLFLHHFLVADKTSGRLDEKSKELLKQRAKMVDQILITGESRLAF